MQLKAFFCDPLLPQEIELSAISPDTIIDQFEKIEWNDYFQKIQTAKLDDVYFDPSFVVENTENKTELVISAVGEPNHYAFRITYKRPKKVKSFLGLNDKIDEDYSTAIQGQTKDAALDCLNALLRNDTEFLSARFGQ